MNAGLILSLVLNMLHNYATSIPVQHHLRSFEKCSTFKTWTKEVVLQIQPYIEIIDTIHVSREQHVWYVSLGHMELI